MNDNLLTGPDLLQNLIGIIFRFREQKIAITADVEAMFLQVKVPPQDSKVLRFLWRDNPSEPVKVSEYGRHIWSEKFTKMRQLCSSASCQRQCTRLCTNCQFDNPQLLHE